LFSICRAQTSSFYLYSLTQTSPNSVSIWSGDSNGLLTYVGKTLTGSNSSPVQSQNPLIVYDDYVFATNSKDSTVSMFSINRNKPAEIRLLGSNQNAGGDWPLSVTARSRTKFGEIVCVANSGQTNGFGCMPYTPNGLSPVGLKAIFNLTLTTPPASHMGPSQIQFTPDGSGLAVVVKGFNPPIDLFTFNTGSLVQSSSNGHINFAFEFDTDGTMVLVDASPYNNGSGIIDVTLKTGVSPSVTFTPPNYYIIPQQSSACWITRSKQTGYFYVSNAASANITEISRSGSTFTVINEYPASTPTDVTIVSISGQDYLYVNDDGIIRVYKLSKTSRAQSVQNLTRADGGGQGLATYVVPRFSNYFY